MKFDLNNENPSIRTLEANNSTYKGVWYLISATWLEKWKSWSRRNSLDPRPGPIDNGVFFTPAGSLKPNLRVSDDYRGLSEPTWFYLHRHYGGGPVVCRRVVDIFASPVEPPEQNDVPDSACL